MRTPTRAGEPGPSGAEDGSVAEQITGLLDEAEKLLEAIRYDEAVQRARRAVELTEEHESVSPALQAESLLALASVLQEMGEPPRAMVLAEQAVALFETVPGRSGEEGVASALFVSGRLATDLGDGDRAERALLRAIRIDEQLHGVDHPEVATDLSALGSLYERQGRFDEAERALVRALEIDQRAFGDEHSRTASSRSDLAVLLMGSGDPARLDRAEELLSRALEVHREAHGERHPSVATDLTNLAGLRVLRGEHRSAEPLLRRAVAIDRELLGDLHPDSITGLGNLASLEAALGRPEEALGRMREVAERDARLIEQVFSVSSERRRSDLVDILREHLEALLSLVVRHLNDSPEAVRLAFELVVRRKGLELEALAIGKKIVTEGGDPSAERLARELRQVRQRLAELALSPRDVLGDPRRRMEELDALEAREEELETELARSLPGAKLERGLRGVDRDRLAARLPPGSLLIDLFRFQPFDETATPTADDGAWEKARYLAFLLPAGAPEGLRMIDLGEAEPIDTAVAALRRTLDPWGRRDPKPHRAPRHQPASPSDSRLIEEPARELARRSVVPMLSVIPHDAPRGRRLLLCPDGPLALIPFEVLPDAAGGFLADQYDIHYLSTARDLLRRDGLRDATGGRPLVVADPAFDLGGIPWQRPFRALRGTREEGRVVARLLDAELWMGADALEARLQQIASPTVLHLATHGFFFVPEDVGFGGEPVEDPLLRSGLALAGANIRLRGEPLPREAGDGLLTAKEVTGLDLRGTRLVVLSACETGLGDVRDGEGVLGLRRAFTLAGAENLVISLWPVPDAETRLLMEGFYRRLIEGQSPADALRGARLALRERHPDPSLWGAFICVGWAPGPSAELPA
ncbi:MAG: CHAT domain-containing protein [Acidobacteriota bacterium]|jgi:CHAT domain-containing protein/tetratricopeptide (TPR) repeat protein